MVSIRQSQAGTLTPQAAAIGPEFPATLEGE